MIRIAQKLRPFSHTPGISCLVPGSSWEVQIFPTRFYLRNLVEKRELLVECHLQGPIDDFTVQQDLEKGQVRVFGCARSGYFCYSIRASLQGIFLFVEKPLLEIAFKEQVRKIPKGEAERLVGAGEFVNASHERLSLGSHRMQEWEHLVRRSDLSAILPIWLNLGQRTPSVPLPEQFKGGNLPLLAACAEAVSKRVKVGLMARFAHLFQAAFSGMLVPSLEDRKFLGLVPQEKPPACSPLLFLTEGARLIRSLFISEEGEKVIILPCLPPELHAGRLLHLSLQGGDSMDMEWSKKSLRRLIWRSIRTRSIQIQLPSDVKTFRLRHRLQEKGKLLKVGEPLAIEAGEVILLDRFAE